MLFEEDFSRRKNLSFYVTDFFSGQVLAILLCSNTSFHLKTYDEFVISQGNAIA